MTPRDRTVHRAMEMVHLNMMMRSDDGIRTQLREAESDNATREGDCSDSLQLLLLRAHGLFLDGLFDEALLLLNSAEENKFDNYANKQTAVAIPVLANAGNILSQMGKTQTAHATLSSILRNYGDDLTPEICSALYYNIGLLHLLDTEDSAAENTGWLHCFARSLPVLRRSPFVWLRLARGIFNSPDEPELRELLHVVQQSDSGAASPAIQCLENCEVALSDLEAHVDDHNRDGTLLGRLFLHLYKSYACLSRSEWDQAITHAKRCLALSTEGSLNDAAEGVGVAVKAAKHYMTEAMCHVSLAEESEQELKRTIEGHSPDSNGAVDYDNLKCSSGLSRQERELLSLQINASHSSAVVGNLERAEESASKAHSIDPTCPQSALALAYSRFRLGRADDAMQLLQQFTWCN